MLGNHPAPLRLEKLRELFDQGLASQRESEQARIRVDELRSRVAEASAELTRVDVNLSRQSVQIVRAPRAGVISQLNAGDTATFVNAGDVLASFVPDDVGRAVELFVDGRDVALVRPGAKVRLQFEGWPMVQFSGWPNLAVGTFGGEVLAIDPTAQTNGRFLALVTEDPEFDPPWPDQRFVRFGSNARGWVLLDTVPVGYELWRRMNNFPPNLPGQPQQAHADDSEEDREDELRGHHERQRSARASNHQKATQWMHFTSCSNPRAPLDAAVGHPSPTKGAYLEG